MTSENFQVPSETLANNITGNQPKCQKSIFQNNALLLWRLWNFKLKKKTTNPVVSQEHKLKQMKNTAITQNNSCLQYQWATEIFQQFDFDKHCRKREEGQVKLHFPEDTIRGGTKSFCNIKKKKK